MENLPIIILIEKELEANSVIKYYLTTAADGKQYEVAFYALDMILAIGFRVRSKRGTQFRIWANQHLKSYMIKGFVMDEVLPFIGKGRVYFCFFSDSSISPFGRWIYATKTSNDKKRHKNIFQSSFCRRR